ncbi:T9SS type A sorting domain-containing protein [Ekhidna sp.]|uniref:T9SS type A sorting domain-containing protein n=1 Tax=Ekhidna sp. TaxID=2608089 RepID=UPI003B5B30D0
MTNVLVKKFLLFASIVVALNQLASAQNVTFNDTNFKNALLAHDPVIDTNGDDEIQVSEAEAFTGFLNLYYQSISDATGLEAFINITKLNISQNSLTNLDVTDLTALTYLYAYSNSLSSIDVSQNTQLDTLVLFTNQLTTLDLNSNTGLIYLDVRGNQLTSIDVTNNINLKGINFWQNEISTFTFPASIESSLTQLGYGDNPLSNTFDFTQFPNLEYLECRTSNLTSIDVSSLSNLKSLIIIDNPITTIDLSQNTSLEMLYSSNTSMTELDLSSNVNLTFFYHWSADFYETESLIESINLANGNNDKLDYIAIGDNPNLTCIQVDNPTDPFPNATTLTLNGFSNFRDICVPGQIVFIDKAFETALLEHTPAIDTDADGVITKTEAAAYTGVLDIGQNPIKNVSEIRYFTGITGLDVAQTDIGNLDLSENPALTTLDISGISELRVLSLDNGNNEAITNITWASWYPSFITVDDPVYSENNWNFFPAANYCTDCTASVPTAFENRLIADGYDLNDDGDIQVSEAEQITELKYTAYTSLSIISGFEAFTALQTLELPTTFNTSIINLTQCTKLTTLKLPGAAIGSIDLSMNPLLSTLQLNGMENSNFTSLDLRNNPALSNLYLNDSYFEEVDISNNKELRTVVFRNNALTELDFSHVPGLSHLDVQDNNLTSLNVKNGNIEGIFAPQFRTNGNPNLTCIAVDDVAYAEANFINIDEGQSFDIDCDDFPIPFADANLETALLSYTPAIDLNADGDIRLSEAAAFTGVLDLSGLSITTADELQYFTGTTGLDISDNNLTLLNVKNGNNQNFTVFDATGNSGLSCIKVDQARYSEENWTNIDAGASFSAYCDSDEIVHIPDGFWKTSIINSGVDSNSDGDITYGEALAYTGELRTFSYAVTDLTGIEAFENLDGLRIEYQASLNEVDVTANTQLTSFIFTQSFGEGVAEIDLSNNLLLETINVSRTAMTGLDLTLYPNLTDFNCNSCELLSVDLSQNTSLQFLNLYYNDIPSIDLSNNTLLTRLYLDYNNLNELNLTGLTNIEQLSASGNNITSLDVSNLTGLTSIELLETNVVSLDLMNNNLLERIDIYGGDGTEGEPQRGKLEELILPSDPSRLYYLQLEYNNIQYIDLSNVYFDPEGTLNNSVVYLYSNDLKEINIGKVYSLDIYDNPNLTCAQTTDVAYAEANYSYDEGVSFNTFCASKQNDILTFSLAEQTSEAVIDKDNHTVGIEVEIGTDVTNLTPTITVSDNATYSPGGAQDFTNSVVYTVTAEDGSTQDWNVSVIVGENTAPTLETAFEDLSEEEGFGSVLISYVNAFADADGHSLTISVESSNTDVVTVELASNNNIRVTEVGIGVSTITVTASDGFGGSVSDEFTFTVTEAPLGLVEDLSVKLYPNPTVDFLNIGSSKSLEVKLIDLNGRTLQIANGQHIQMDLRAIEAGMYLLKISDGESTETKRIIKAN